MENSSDIIYDKFAQVKMLILFVMSRLHGPIAMDALTELALCDERINYFDVTECISELVKSEHLCLKDGIYALTAKGRQNGEILEDNLPHSVRVKAEAAASRINELMTRESLIKTHRNACGKGGFNVGLALSDGVSDILTIEMFAANEQQASILEKGFRKNAQTLYRDIAEMVAK